MNYKRIPVDPNRPYHEPFGHRYDDKPNRKYGAELGVQLAECWHKNALAGNCRAGGATFEEWLAVLSRGDTQAEIAGKARYKAILAASKSEAKR